MDEYILVVSDGETSETINCTANQLPALIEEFTKNEYLMVATIVKVLSEEVYES